jgi:hypothetical protein
MSAGIGRVEKKYLGGLVKAPWRMYKPAKFSGKDR